MKFKLNTLNVFYNSPETGSYETHIYEKQKETRDDKTTEEQEKVKQLNISDNIKKINSLIDRLNKNGSKDENTLNLICNFVNQAIENKNAKFMIVENKDNKKEIWLVIEKNGTNSQIDAQKILNNIEKNIKEKDWSLFFDKNNNNKKDVWEFSIDKNWKIDGVDIKEGEKRSYADLDSVFKGKYYNDWKKFIYEVWSYQDKGAAILRQITALSDELWLNTKDYKKIKKDIENLYVYKDWENVIFSKEKPDNINAKQVKDLEINIKWKSYKWIDALNWKVHPHDKIDISSLANALNPKIFKVDNTITELKNSKEKKENNKFWWTFYISWGVENWDLPDDKTIIYKKTDKSSIHTNGKNLQINAKNIFDTENKGDNKFSYANKIWDKYLIIWENPTNKSFQITTDKDIKSQLKNSWVEAWLASYDKNWNMIIEEVWDPKVHEFITTNNSVESWKSVNNPIYLDTIDNNDNYIFKREINWKEKDIAINKNKLINTVWKMKDDKTLNLKKDQLEDIFWKDFKIDNLFTQFNWKNNKIFFEFKNLSKDSKTNESEDVLLSFEKTLNWDLKITKVDVHKDIDLSNWWNTWNWWDTWFEGFDSWYKRDLITQCEIVKTVNKDSIETKPIKNLWYPSFIIKKQWKNLVISKKDDKKEFFEVRWINIKNEEDLKNFLDKDFVNVIFAASNPNFLKKDKNNELYLDYKNINQQRSEIKNYIKNKIKDKITWDKLIKDTISKLIKNEEK